MSPAAKKEPAREKRIQDEAVVDAYGPEEQAMGWYYYLQDKIIFPFQAKCVASRAISPLSEGQAVQVLSMAPEAECEHEMFVEIRWEKRTLAVPLVQLQPLVKTEADTKEAVADWHYWVRQGYQF